MARNVNLVSSWREKYKPYVFTVGLIHRWPDSRVFYADMQGRTGYLDMFEAWALVRKFSYLNSPSNGGFDRNSSIAFLAPQPAAPKPPLESLGQKFLKLAYSAILA